LQLKKLLSHRLASQLQFLGKLGNGRRPIPLERKEDRATAVWKLVYGDYGRLLDL